jgi:cellulose synthase/poly-beta-1,6-N-acetylglucosamine synthase-like glycosyltransferase
MAESEPSARKRATRGQAARRDVARPPAPALLCADPLAQPPDPRLLEALPPLVMLRERLLPWRRLGGGAVVLAADPAAAARHLPLLEGALGPVRLARARPEALAAALALHAGRPLVHAAETRVAPQDSCRTLPRRPLVAAAAATGAILLAALLLAPLALLAALTLGAAVTALAASVLKAAGLAASLRRDDRDAGAIVVPARLPVISVLVPLYREREVASHLLARMAALDYPRDRLDLCLVVEDDDRLTRDALSATTLPPWAQVVTVPEGTLRTKPRALNYALPFAKGSIVGIYDAEDLPAPDHLRRVAETFARRGPRVACLQGALDYYNWQSNLMARLFALEYAAWFRVLLPGLVRLGLAIPLGGTTLFLRREAIEAVGGWDAHNVTEDADLGIRLARKGYGTEMIAIATQEEANCRPWPWVRQRSRWLKGYAVTWAVHMRVPRRLWRELGPRRFWAFQVLFLGTLAGFTLAPLLWLLWLVPLGLPHPLAPLLPGPALAALAGLFLAGQALDLACAALGAARAGKARLGLWAPLLPLYFPLATLAVWRAWWEVAACPFRWDKTAHGIDPPAGLATLSPPPAPAPRRAAAAS